MAVSLPFFKKTESESEREKREILEAMRRTREELRMARAFFNDACEPELVEASVYEINSLQARYAYFLRLARELKCEQKENEEFRALKVSLAEKDKLAAGGKR